MKKTGKTARFSDVVKVSGQPEVVYLWTKPEEDGRFMKAVQQNRLLTVKQETVGSKADFGVVGFVREPNVSYFEFPKSLSSFQDRRITGIKYDLVKTAPVGRPVRSEEIEVPRKRRGSRRAALGRQTDKRPKRYRVTIRFTAIAETAQEVEASSKRIAAEQAGRAAQTPDFRGKTVTRKIVKIAEVD